MRSGEICSLLSRDTGRPVLSLLLRWAPSLPGSCSSRAGTGAAFHTPSQAPPAALFVPPSGRAVLKAVLQSHVLGPRCLSHLLAGATTVAWSGASHCLLLILLPFVCQPSKSLVLQLCLGISVAPGMTAPFSQWQGCVLSLWDSAAMLCDGLCPLHVS